MFDLNAIATDTKKEIEGVWYDVGDGLQLKVARMNNPQYVKRLNEVSAPYRAQVKAGTLSDEKKAELAAGVMAETILLDWRGMFLGGKPLPYSRKKAAEILADPRYQAVFSLVMSFAQDEAAFRIEEVKTELGEFSTITGGS